jgi:hypothetical protein
MYLSVIQFSGQKAEWIQPKTSENLFELHAGEALLARLAFRSMWGTLAVAETADGSWSFKRVGFLNPRVTVRVLDQPEDLAVYQPKFWGDGTLTFADGRSLAWKPLNFWATIWAFKSADDQTLITFKPGREKEKLSDIFKTQATVELGLLLNNRDLLPILLPLGMYLVALHSQDAAGAAAVTAGAAA